jgi:hypothetical protein
VTPVSGLGDLGSGLEIGLNAASRPGITLVILHLYWQYAGTVLVAMCTRIICHSRNNNEAAPEYSFIASSDTVAHRRDPRPGSAATFKRSVSLKQLVPNILEDQKSMWSFPSRFAKGKDLIPTAAFAVIGTALVVGADAPAARYFRNTPAFGGYNRTLFTELIWCPTHGIAGS